MQKLSFLGLILTGCLAWASEADAQFPCGFYGAGPGHWYGVPTMWQYSYNGRTPPYFAVHPPVYYSGEIVRIPYGNSPWAAAPIAAAAPAATIPATIPSSLPSTIPSAPPMMIENPHSARGAAKKAAFSSPTTPAERALKISAPIATKPGQMIFNMHYHSQDKVATK